MLGVTLAVALPATEVRVERQVVWVRAHGGERSRLGPKGEKRSYAHCFHEDRPSLKIGHEPCSKGIRLKAEKLRSMNIQSSSSFRCSRLALSMGAFLLLTSPLVADPFGVATRSIPDYVVASKKANKLFDEAFQASLERSPTELSNLGSKKFYDRWDDLSTAELRARHDLSQQWAQRIEKELKGQKLDAETELSRQLFAYDAKREAEAFRFREYDYPVNQMFGLHAEVPAFMINVHRIEDLSDARAYLTRLERLPSLFRQLTEGMKRREDKGILPPAFVFDYVLSDVNNLLKGFPITDDENEKHTLYADFEKKIKALKLDSDTESEFLSRGKKAVRTSVAQAYGSLRKTLLEQKERAGEDDGVWKFPQGAEYYAHRLAHNTTTDMSADQIHELGLSEVKRIHGEMRKIMKQVKFEGSLQEFFVFMREDSQFYYSNDKSGKKAYLDKAVGVVDDMKLKLDKLFLTKPKADLVVKAVEPFREKSAGKAFYQSPALDGSRPGYYYANLYDMKNMPKYQMEALAYHEGIPGHHMQLSISQELETLPRFRRLGGYTAYIEGWGLYSERLPKEFGFYKDPYSDFGRQAMELWRACRLVVDTGIHHKRWTRAQGVEYYSNNTPNSQDDCQKMVDRHIVMPGQATAYKVGMNEILRLRESARRRLGSRFNIKEFHEVVLTHGALPLAVLEELVKKHIASKL